ELYVPIFNQLGYNCFIAEYRGYSMSSGQPGLVKMLNDVHFIIEAINQPINNLILFGRSVGSIYAIHAANNYPEIPGLIIESGIADIMDRLLLRIHPEEIGATFEEMHTAVKCDFNHQEKLSKFRGASLIMHTMGDSLINYLHGENLYDWAPEPKVLKLFERGDHNTIFFTNSDEYKKTILRFLSKFD
ncbi:alpha/beta hydrolase, partial [candidate division KSB1 bacterium]